MRTPRSRIKGELRRLFVKSVERSETMKREHYTCQICKKKQTTKKGQEIKIECHHINTIDWDELINIIQDKLLCDSSQLQCLCVDCHKNITY
jgi:predicted HNH restriction endonuclease